MIDELDTIETFRALLNEICWSYNYPEYEVLKHDEGYSLNKLYIMKDRVSYKTDNWNLAPGVFEQFEEFLKFLESTDAKE